MSCTWSDVFILFEHTGKRDIECLSCLCCERYQILKQKFRNSEHFLLDYHVEVVGYDTWSLE